VARRETMLLDIILLFLPCPLFLPYPALNKYKGDWLVLSIAFIAGLRIPAQWK
jgi:hypothetical protein